MFASNEMSIYEQKDNPLTWFLKIISFWIKWLTDDIKENFDDHPISIEGRDVEGVVASVVAHPQIGAWNFISVDLVGNKRIL